MLMGLCASALFAPQSRAQSDLRTIDRQIDAQFTRRYQNARTLKHSLRAENIRDEEVKEIQMVVAALDRGFITSIGGVVAGCHCEEGPACTDEISVALQKAGRTVGMNFSKIEGKWQLGELQKWDLKYQAVLAKYRDISFAPARERGKLRQAYAEELATLLAEMPQCAANPTPSPPVPKDSDTSKSDVTRRRD
jgi:hypothetical protein